MRRGCCRLASVVPGFKDWPSQEQHTLRQGRHVSLESGKVCFLRPLARLRKKIHGPMGFNGLDLRARLRPELQVPCQALIHALSSKTQCPAFDQITYHARGFRVRGLGFRV